jgi:hypothetical protein
VQWPWRRRREQPRHAVSRQPASWAEPAFPPAPVTTELATAVPVAPVDVPVQAAGVRLGFADGSEVALDERDPSALALRAVADLLVQDGPH